MQHAMVHHHLHLLLMGVMHGWRGDGELMDQFAPVLDQEAHGFPSLYRDRFRFVIVVVEHYLHGPGRIDGPAGLTDSATAVVMATARAVRAGGERE
ncbi:MAG: hypothetical protein Kilf2KO_35680 [Rhodospirillales bacterium]